MSQSRIEKIVSGKASLLLIAICASVVLVLSLITYADLFGLADKISGTTLQNIGLLHPIVVHIPVGLVFFGYLLEILSWKQFNSTYRTAIQILHPVLILSLAVSIIFGLLLSSVGDYGKSLLDTHFWSAAVSLLLAEISLLLHHKAIQNDKSFSIIVYRFSFTFLVLTTLFAGHAGASLTHGEDYLSQVFSASQSESASNVLVTNNSENTQLSPEQARELGIEARAILAHNCYKCHGPDKVKGDLRLDIKEMFLKGGEHGPVMVAGNATESELIRRVMLPASDEDAMPTKGKRLTANEVAVLTRWIDSGAPWPDVDAPVGFRVAPLAPRNPTLPANTGRFSNPVDIWVDKYFNENEIKWPAAIDDKQLIRRLYLDLIGLLPSPAEQDAFVSDPSKNKIEKQVDQLLARSDDYSIHWLTFWNDLLRNDYTGTGYITGGRFSITDWLYQSIRENKSYDMMVEQLLNPDDKAKGFVSGIRWRGVVNASQTTEMQAAQNVAQVFLGLNLKCASCHNSFINNWQLTDAYGMANVFADSSLEIHRCDQPTGKYVRPKMLWEELGSIDSMATRARKMAQLAKIMTKPENGRLYRTIVNRVWKQLMGRGIIEPVDQMDNLPWSQDLIDWLAFNFQQKGSDIKWLIKLIVTSTTYRLPADGLKQPADLIASNFKFRGMVRKRMTAEQFTDAASMLVDSVFGKTEMRYQPASFSELPAGTVLVRAALVANNPLLLALGRPTRETVTSSRESQANLLQAMEMTNGQRLHQTLKRGAQRWVQLHPSGQEAVQLFYLKALGRPASADELRVAIKNMGDKPSAEAVEDFFWAMLLHPEFQLIN